MGLTETIQIAGAVVATIFLPLLGALQFYDSKRRKAESEAKKAEEDAKRLEAENISSYAAEWKELYEKKEKKSQEQDAKIDSLYEQINEDRQRIRELMEKNTKIELDKMKLEVTKCVRRGCKDREPQSDY